MLSTIASARSSIRVAAYTFSAPYVVRALLDAKKRGVDVQVVVDHRNNVLEDGSGKQRAALSALVNAGIPTRTVSAFPIHHDKYLLLDGQVVLTGSYNFTVAAATRNSENVIVVRGDPGIAQQYLDHWQRRFAAGIPFSGGY